MDLQRCASAVAQSVKACQSNTLVKVGSLFFVKRCKKLMDYFWSPVQQWLTKCHFRFQGSRQHWPLFHCGQTRREKP